jgi:hypothetical protein
MNRWLLGTAIHAILHRRQAESEFSPKAWDSGTLWRVAEKFTLPALVAPKS